MDKRTCTKCDETKELSEFPLLDRRKHEAKWCMSCRIGYIGNTPKKQYDPLKLKMESWRQRENTNGPISLTQAVDLLIQSIERYGKLNCNFCVKEIPDGDWNIDKIMVNDNEEIVLICEKCFNSKYADTKESM